MPQRTNTIMPTQFYNSISALKLEDESSQETVFSYSLCFWIHDRQCVQCFSLLFCISICICSAVWCLSLVLWMSNSHNLFQHTCKGKELVLQSALFPAPWISWNKIKLSHVIGWIGSGAHQIALFTAENCLQWGSAIHMPGWPELIQETFKPSKLQNPSLVCPKVAGQDSEKACTTSEAWKGSNKIAFSHLRQTRLSQPQSRKKSHVVKKIYLSNIKPDHALLLSVLCRPNYFSYNLLGFIRSTPVLRHFPTHQSI